MLPSEIEAVAQQHGIRESMAPAYAGDRQTVARAIAKVSSEVARSGWMLDSIRASKSEVVYAIVQKSKDAAHEHIDYAQCAKVRWCAEVDAGAHIQGAHAIAGKVEEAYQELRGKVVAGDWTESLTSYLVGDCYAQAIREDGRVYWVAPAHLETVRRVQPFLGAVGISLVICEVETESTAVVQAAAQEGLADQLATLQAEVEAFDGTQKPSTYRLRVEALQTLRKRATVYAGTLGIAVDQVQAVIDQLEAKAQEMLTLRERTVVHRDGSSERNSPNPTTTNHSSSSSKEAAAVFYASRPACRPLEGIDTPSMPTASAGQQTGFSW